VSSIKGAVVRSSCGASRVTVADIIPTSVCSFGALACGAARTEPATRWSPPPRRLGRVGDLPHASGSYYGRRGASTSKSRRVGRGGAALRESPELAGPARRTTTYERLGEQAADVGIDIVSNRALRVCVGTLRSWHLAHFMCHQHSPFHAVRERPIDALGDGARPPQMAFSSSTSAPVPSADADHDEDDLSARTNDRRSMAG
jgi:hypothetical protein